MNAVAFGGIYKLEQIRSDLRSPQIFRHRDLLRVRRLNLCPVGLRPQRAREQNDAREDNDRNEDSEELVLVHISDDFDGSFFSVIANFADRVSPVYFC
jgi:hypothetical protein